VVSSHLAALPPLSLYVHIPWCVRKCPYCDFNSHEWRGAADSVLPEQEYVRALMADLDAALPEVWGRPVSSIFFGGGTPSLFSGEAIDMLLAAFRARLPVEADAEVTLEANPGTVEAHKFRDFRAAGVNRLSIGVQSFNPRHLKALGRIHDEREAQRAIELAGASFDSFNIDIMYALPQQTLAEASGDVSAALASGAPHVSAYHLTIEPHTWFHDHPPTVPDEDAAADIHDMVEGRLTDAGLDHYETSAYARPGLRCRHNLNYWRFGDYLGIGAGAHSKISSAEAIVRSMRARQPRDYVRRALQGSAVDERSRVAAADLPFEFMMNGLRLTEGITLEDFQARTGLPAGTVEPALALAQERGLIDRREERVRPTLRGRRFLNDLLQLFLAASAESR
jgi:putative oxygen-independent coproporphyrinogen III oxidase